MIEINQLQTSNLYILIFGSIFLYAFIGYIVGYIAMRIQRETFVRDKIKDNKHWRNYQNYNVDSALIEYKKQNERINLTFCYSGLLWPITAFVLMMFFVFKLFQQLNQITVQKIEEIWPPNYE